MTQAQMKKESRTSISSREEELWQAIEAGETAGTYVKEALDAINSASNWGLVDIFGGKLFTSFAKRNKINEANEKLKRACSETRYFGSLIHDPLLNPSIHVENDDVLSIMDVFLDNGIFDLLTQSRIEDAKKNLKQLKEAIDLRLEDLHEEVDELI